MRRTQATPSPARALAACERMMREAHALELLRAHLPAGASRADARERRERIMQQGRRPCTFLDRPLGIQR